MGEAELPGKKQVYEVQRVAFRRDKSMKFMKKLFDKFNKKQRTVKRKRIKRVNRSYVFQKVKSNDIVRLLGLFHVENIFMEIINFKKDSSFYKNIQSIKDEYVVFSNSSSENDAEIFISKCSGENFNKILDEIIEDKPELLIFYLTNLSLEDFLCYNRNSYRTNMITKQISVCVFEIIFDENVYSVTFNSDLLHGSDFISKLDEILIK